jgi:hypothetical protein
MLIRSVHFGFFFLLPNTPNILMSAIFLFFAISDKIFLTSVQETYITAHIHPLVPDINA